VHIVIVGCGRVGSGLATALSTEGHSVAVIDRNAKQFRRVGSDFAGSLITGSGFDRGCLEEAGVTRADALAAVTSGDNSNVLTARIAREHFGVPNVVARIYDPQRAEVYQRLGIATVATVTWTIDQVRQWLLPVGGRPSWSDATGQLVVVERPLPAHFAGHHLSAMLPAHLASVVAVTRAGKPRLETAHLVGQEGDLLLLAVLAEHVDELDTLLAGDGGAA
jgi:trk system potassium uptake protein TrkA